MSYVLVKRITSLKYGNSKDTRVLERKVTISKKLAHLQIILVKKKPSIISTWVELIPVLVIITSALRHIIVTFIISYFQVIVEVPTTNGSILEMVEEQPILLGWLAGVKAVPISILQAFLPESPST